MPSVVSRETPAPPPAPPVAATVFGPRLPQAEVFCELLAREATVRGLIGPREVPRLWERHLLNCAVVAELIPVDARVADIGSGAGLPGVVLALMRPELEITLVEPLLRRTAFLELVASTMEVPGLVVRRDRAEALEGRETYDVVVSRAVAPMDRLAAWCLPLTRQRGQMLAIKGRSVASEFEAAAPAIRRYGGAPPDVVEVGASVLAEPTTVARVVRSGDRIVQTSRNPRKGNR